MNIEQSVEKLENRVEKLEHSVTELRVDVAHIKGTLPSLAKQEDIAAIKAQLGNFATHSDIKNLIIGLMGIGVTSIIGIVFGILNYLK